MNIRKRLKKWRLMYDFLYTLAVGNSCPDNFKRAGKECQIGENQTLHPELISLDNWSRLQNNNNVIALSGHLLIKKFAAVSSQCIIIPEAHTPTVGLPQFLSITHINDKVRDIVVNEDAWVGAGCILMSKCEIGRGAIIGSGSIVTKKIPPYAVALGSPAKIVAVRFSIGQILRHEEILYPPEERLSKDFLLDLFAKHFDGLKTIGTSEISENDMIKLERARQKYGIIDYSKSHL